MTRKEFEAAHAATLAATAALFGKTVDEWLDATPFEQSCASQARCTVIGFQNTHEMDPYDQWSELPRSWHQQSNGVTELWVTTCSGEFEEQIGVWGKFVSGIEFGGK